jgi:hypothetical protein
VPGEDVEDDDVAIDDERLAAHKLLKRRPLSRAQRVEDHDAVGSPFAHERRKLICLAGADQRRRIDLRTALYDARDDLRAGRTCERGKLVELNLKARAIVAGVDTGDDDAFGTRPSVMKGR